MKNVLLVTDDGDKITLTIVDAEIGVGVSSEISREKLDELLTLAEKLTRP